MKTISIALLMSIFTAFCLFALILQCPGGNCAMAAQAKVDEGECEKLNQLEETIEHAKETEKCGEVDNRTLRERIKDAAWDLSQKATDLGHMVKEKMGEKYEGLKETISWGKEEGEHELNKAGEKVGEKVEEKMDDEDDRTLAQRISDAARELSEKAYALGRMGKEKTGEQYENLKETVSMGRQKGAEKGEEARRKVGEKVEEVEEAVDDRTIRQRISDAASDLSEKASELGRMIKDKTGEKYEDLKETIGLGQQEGKEKLEEAKQKVGQKVEEGKERVGGKVKEGKEKVGEKVEEGSEDARTYAQRIGDAARELSERAAELGRMAKDKTGEKYEDLKETIGLGQQEGKEKYEQTKQKVGQKVEEGEDARTYAQRIGDAARDLNERTAELGRMVKDKAGEKYENLKETIGQKHEEAIEAGKKIGGKVQEKIGDGEDNRTIREKINDAARELSEKTFELGQMLKGKVGEKYEEMKDALGQQQEENERSGAFHEDGECEDKASNAYSSVSKSAGQAAEYARQRALEALKSAQEYLEQSDPEAKMQPSAEKSMSERVMDGMRSARDAVADAAKSLGGKVVGAEEAPLKHDVPQTPVVHEHEHATEGSDGKGIGSRVSEGLRKAREAVVSAGQRLMETVGDGIVRVGDDAAVVP